MYQKDPVRPELDLERLFAERKIYGLKYENNIEQLFVLHIQMKYQQPLEKWII